MEKYYRQIEDDQDPVIDGRDQYRVEEITQEEKEEIKNGTKPTNQTEETSPGNETTAANETINSEAEDSQTDPIASFILKEELPNRSVLEASSVTN